MKNILNYDDFEAIILESKTNFSVDDSDFETMTSISKMTHGMDGVIMWLGPNKKYKNNIVKISNTPNDKRGDDCFIMSLKDFKIYGNLNKSFITLSLFLLLSNLKRLSGCLKSLSFLLPTLNIPIKKELIILPTSL